uniref:Uncharacterized protein n=1 Tax=viral metagenome TaxID=1070528 RepID=A0A6M3LIA2_9ZZZZ
MKAKKVKSAVLKNLAVKPEQVETNNEVDSLRDYILEAEQVDLLKRQNGWNIIERDFKQYKDEISSKLAYLDPKSKEFSEARILYISADKLLKMFDDYAENRKRAIELLNRIDNPRENIILDVDN